MRYMYRLLAVVMIVVPLVATSSHVRTLSVGASQAFAHVDAGPSPCGPSEETLAYVHSGQAVSGTLSYSDGSPNDDNNLIILSLNDTTVYSVRAVPDTSYSFSFTASQDGLLCGLDEDGDDIITLDLYTGPVNPRETIGGCNLSEPGTSESQRSCGDPVNTFTGNFTHTFDDFSLTGRGFPLTFSHTYNSWNAGINGPLGPGWTFNDGMALLTNTPSSGSVTIRQQNGSEVTFTTSGSSYTAPPRVLATLAHNADGTWTFTRRAREFFTFNAAGQLTQEQDLNGYAITFTYSSGQLTTITDSSGRALGLTWTGSHITRVTDPLGRHVDFAYDATTGNLVSCTDVNGGVTSFTYGTGDRLQTMTDPRGTVLQNTYDASGRVTAQTLDPTGLNRTTSISYTANANGTETTLVTDPSGHETQEHYGRNGALLDLTRGYGAPNVIQIDTFGYDLDTMQQVMATHYDSGANSEATTRLYDTQGNLLSETDAMGRTRSFTYDALSDLLTATDGNGVTTTYTYDSHGNPLTRSRPLAGTSGAPSGSQTTAFHYADAAHPGDVTSETDPLSQVWSFTYDAYGDQASETDPLGNKTTFGYNTDGWLTSMVSPRGNVTGGTPVAYTTTFGHDAFGNLTTITDPLGHTTTRHYDADQNLDSYTDGRGNVTTYTYNRANEPVTTTRQDGTTLQTAYNPDETIGSRTDGAGNGTRYGYDALSRLTSVTDPLGRTTSLRYDGFDNLTGVTDPLGQLQLLEYNQDNEVISGSANWYGSLQVPIQRGWNLLNLSTFDDLYNDSYVVSALNSALGSSTGISALATYRNGRFDLYIPGYSANQSLGTTDGMFVLSTVAGIWTDSGNTYSEGVPTPLRAGWNLVAEPFPLTGLDTATIAGQLQGSGCGLKEIALLRNGSYVTYVPGVSSNIHVQPYEGMWLLCAGSSSWTPTGPSPDFGSVTYDADGQLTSMTDGTGTSSFTYDSLNRLTGQTDGAGQSIAYAYDLNDDQTGITYPGGRTVTQTYDAADRLQSITDWLGHTTSFGYDPNDNLTTETLPTGTGIVDTFGYDAADRLMSISDARSGSAFATFTYNRDANDMLLSARATGVPGVAESYAYTGLDQLHSVNGGSYAYDAADNLTGTPAGASLHYDIADELTSLGAGTGTTTFTYDAAGDRTSTTPPSGPSTSYLWDGAHQLVQYNGTQTYLYNGLGLRTAKTSNGAVEPYVWDLAAPLPLMLQDGGTSYVYGPGGLPLEQISPSNSVLYYHHDQLGSTRVVTDGAGTVQGTYTYDAFGNLADHTGSVTQPFGFAGQYTDAESGLQYLRDRYYDPATAQFLSLDPLADQTLSPYAYADNNPLALVDPSGLDGLKLRNFEDIPHPQDSFEQGQHIQQQVEDVVATKSQIDSLDKQAIQVIDTANAVKNGELTKHLKEEAKKKAESAAKASPCEEYKNLNQNLNQKKNMETAHTKSRFWIVRLFSEAIDALSGGSNGDPQSSGHPSPTGGGGTTGGGSSGVGPGVP